jgi:hypothetical protein
MLSAPGSAVIVDAARRVGQSGPVGWWVIPTSDGAIIFFGARESGSGGGGITTLELIAEAGVYLAGSPGLALLVADGYDVVRCGTVDVAVVDNFALVDPPDGASHLELIGSAGRRRVSLGRPPGG